MKKIYLTGLVLSATLLFLPVHAKAAEVKTISCTNLSELKEALGDCESLSGILQNNFNALQTQLPCQTPVVPGFNCPVPEVPSTETPCPEVLVTQAPSTEAPCPEVPSSEVPSTEVPSTEVPSTEAPVTQAPSTEVPVTQAPSTETPSTEVPVTQAPSTEAPEDEGKKTFDQQILELVNIERQKAGLKPLALDYQVQACAQVRAKEIVSNFSHTRPNGSSCFTALKEGGVSYNASGENIAYGYSDANSVMNAWMNSEGHRANILNPNFTKLGVGLFESGNTLYWSQFFIS